MKNAALSFNSPLLQFLAVHIPAMAPNDGVYKIFRKGTEIGRIIGREGKFQSGEEPFTFEPGELRDLAGLTQTIQDSLIGEELREQLH